MAEALPFALIIIVAVTAQWVAWRLKVPSILLLLPAGFLAGAAGWLDPDHMLGNALNPFVSLSVGLLLFEGGLGLKFRDLEGEGRVVARLVSIGAALTWIGAALGAHYVLGLEWQMAILLGAILMVTGPTVIAPMLRQIRPRAPAAGILRWEGIVIDPIGAGAAVIVLEVILHGGNMQEVAWSVLSLAIAGIAVGILAAAVLLAMLERFAVPGHLEVPVTLLFVLGAIVVADGIASEAGLVAATWMGVQMANQKQARIHSIHEFKETMGLLLIGILFVLLSARIDPSILQEITWKHGAFLAILIAVRYLGAFVSTVGTSLTMHQRLFLGSLAPRGIVAAAVSALFALRLEAAGKDADVLVTTTFIVILGTVFLYGILGRPIARRLGVADPEPRGVLLGGSNLVSRTIAAALLGAGVPTHIIGRDLHAIQAARLDGIEATRVALGTAAAAQDTPMDGMGHFIALTPNDETNSLAILQFNEWFDREHLYQTQPEEEQENQFQGRLLPYTYRTLRDRMQKGWHIRMTPLTEKFGETEFKETHPNALPLFAITQEHFRAAPVPFTPGSVIFSLVPAEEPNNTVPAENHGN